ncbi:MAG: hypothetical protein ACKO0W_07305 [Planctomycetota bacterium]
MATVDFSHWVEEIARHLRGRRWILAAEALAATTKRAEMLARFGVEEVLCVGMTRGLGDEPKDKGFRQFMTGGPVVRGFQESIRAAERIFADPPAELRAMLEAFDPDGSARVLTASFAGAESYFGRPIFGARTVSWRALEDKVVIDRVFAEAGIRTAPHRIVPVSRAALLAAAAQVDLGEGTVWAGDAREGFHGGAEYTRWIRGASDVDEAVRVLSASCDTARVMPFLEGIPCSIHGWVFPDHVAAFRPCEMIVLRSEGQPALRYMSTATTWDPRQDDRDAIRAIARRLGAHLRDRYGYRGTFSIDGVMTKDGFLPTEVNPRCGAALPTLVPGVTDLSMELLHYASIERLPIEWRAREFEESVVAHADANRRAAVASFDCRMPEAERQFALVRDPHWRLATDADGGLPQSKGSHGQAAFGGLLRMVLDPAHVAVGRSAAPVAAEAFAFLDRELGLGVGPLSPARDVRAGGATCA